MEGDRPAPNISKRAAQFLPTATDTPVFNKRKHISYWLRCFKSPLPTQYTSTDASRIALAFFIVSALDVLGVLFDQTTKQERDDCIAWIYRCQHPEGGFRAFTGTYLGDLRDSGNAVWDPAHVPGTYFALAALAILRDDLTRVRRKECLQWLRRVQRSDGSFGQHLGKDGRVDGGMDTRFGYCAMVVRWMLRGDLQGEVEGVPDVDVEALVRCIRGSETHDGGIADEPFHEAHAGFTYCAIGALEMLNRVTLPRSAKPPATVEPPSRQDGISDPNLTVRWLLGRLTTMIEEEEEEHGQDTDGESEHQSSEGFSTAAEAMQTPNSSFSSTQDAGANIGSAHHPTPTYDQTAFDRTGPLSAPSLEQTDDFVHAADAPAAGQDDAEAARHWAGFNGRPNKIADTCYIFWVGGSLSILRSFHLVPQIPLRRYLLEKTQHLTLGGFAKTSGGMPDIFHSYLGLSALSFLDVEDGAADERHEDHTLHAPVEQEPTAHATTTDADTPHHAHLPQPPRSAPTSISSAVTTSDNANMDAAIRSDMPLSTTGEGAMATTSASNAIASADEAAVPVGQADVSKDVGPQAKQQQDDRIADGTTDAGRVLRKVDAALCISERAREWIEGLAWRRER